MWVLRSAVSSQIFRARPLFIPSPFSPSFLFKFPSPGSQVLASPVLLPPPSSLARPSALTLIRGWWSAWRTVFFQQNSWNSWAEFCCGFVLFKRGSLSSVSLVSEYGILKSLWLMELEMPSLPTTNLRGPDDTKDSV